AGAGADPGCRRRGTVVPVTAHPVVCRRLGNAAWCIRLWRGGDDPRWRAAGLGGGTGLRGETRVGTVPGAAAAVGRAGGHRLPFLWCSRRTARGAAAAATARAAILIPLFREGPVDAVGVRVSGAGLPVGGHDGG